MLPDPFKGVLQCPVPTGRWSPIHICLTSRHKTEEDPGQGSFSPTLPTNSLQILGRGSASLRCYRPCARVGQAVVRLYPESSAAAEAAGAGAPIVSSAPCLAPLPTGSSVLMARATAPKAKVSSLEVVLKLCDCATMV